MRFRSQFLVMAAIAWMAMAQQRTSAQDWPQWRGANRDAKTSNFTTPATWPAELVSDWQAEVGDGVATPALVEGKLFVYSRQDGNEVLRCFDATSGQELWQDQNEARGVSGAASSFPGPRSSPTVAQGKVITLGVHGVLSCLDAATGKVLWRNNKLEGREPRFATSSSPIVVENLVIAQLGSERDGGIMAYDLETGDQKWTWNESGPAYGSPILVTVNDKQAIVAPTDQKLVALSVADGQPLWTIDYRQGRYNAATPIVEGQTLIFAGPERGLSAEKMSFDNGVISTQPLWTNVDNSVQFNTPVVKGDQLYGLSTVNNIFCVNLADGQTAWTSSLSGEAAKEEPPVPKEGAGRPGGRGPGEGRQGGDRGGRGGGMRRGGMRGGGGAGYGSVVNAGSVLLALTPTGELFVFRPSAEKYDLIAKYKVAGDKTYAYPIASESAIYIKDGTTITRWSVK